MRILGLIFFLPLLVHAEANFPDLPPIGEVRSALLDSPAVKGAKAGITVEQANETRLKNGAYEFNVRMTAQQRQDNVAQRKMGEWDMIVERPLRLWNKADIDRQLGKSGIDSANLTAGDSMHESGKTLLKMWFAVVREKLIEAEWLNQGKLLREENALVGKRVKAGDAPRLELNLAQAALLQAEYSASQANMREAIAAETLAINFPQIHIPETPSLGTPTPMNESLDYWQQRILGHNHALLLAQNETRRSQLTASRSSADRIPDPTVGVRYSSERGGAEKVVGGVLSFNLPGENRSATSMAALGQAEMAAQREADVLRKIRAEISANYTGARASYNGWEKSRDAAEGMQKNADLIAQAYSLGEASLPDVLAARRLAIESRLTARLAQSDAVEMRYRLLLDAHLLWPLDADDE